jgi:hypothetical protein
VHPDGRQLNLRVSQQRAVDLVTTDDPTRPPVSGTALSIEQAGEATFGPCACCGRPTRRVWGFAYRSDGGAEAAYYVEWVPGAVPEHGAAFDLVVGRWGDGASPADRAAVSLAFRPTERGPEFMVVDAGGRPHASGRLAAVALDRDAVLGSEMAPRAYAVVDAVWLGDARIAELVAPAG